MGMFRSKEQDTAEAVRAKLDAAEQEVVAAEANLRAVSLTAAIGGDEEAGHNASDRLRRARDKAELLHHALASAEQAERDRQAAVASTAEKARIRALRQHLAAMQKAADEFAQKTHEQHEAWKQVVGHGERARKTLKGHEASTLRFRPGGLHALGLEEIQRIGWPQHPLNSQYQFPGCPTPTIYKHDAPTLHDVLESLSEQLVRESGGDVG